MPRFTDNRLVNTIEDVQMAIDHNLDGVVISNHGGRQLDGVAATLDTLRVCAPVAKGKIQIAVDGGVRKGSDIFKAIALGADHVFVGRIPIWGLAVRNPKQTSLSRIGVLTFMQYNGQKGVELAIKMLKEEFATTMKLAGFVFLHSLVKGSNTDFQGRCASVKDITLDRLAYLRHDGILARL